MARQGYFIHFESIKLIGGVKTGDPREKNPDHQQAELGLYYTWTKLGSVPAVRWQAI